MMSSRFADVAGEILAFDMMPEFPEQEGNFVQGHKSKPVRKTEILRAHRDQAVHLLSLLHALALQHAREDWDLGNLQVHRPDAPAPPMNAGGALTKPGTGVSKFRSLDGFWTMFFLPAEQGRVERMNKSMPLHVIDGVSAEEQRLLWGGEWGGGLATGPEAPACERVNAVYQWVQTLIVAVHNSKGLCVPGPVLSRLQQHLGDGMLAYNNVRKFTDTPFPFPYSCGISSVLILYTASVPFLMWAYVEVVWLSCVMTFMASFTYWVLHEVARDMEDPFLYEPNELPLSRLQFLFNQRLLVLRSIAGSKDNLPGPLRDICTAKGLTFPPSSVEARSTPLRACPLPGLRFDGGGLTTAEYLWVPRSAEKSPPRPSPGGARGSEKV